MWSTEIHLNWGKYSDTLIYSDTPGDCFPDLSRIWDTFSSGASLWDREAAVKYWARADEGFHHFAAASS